MHTEKFVELEESEQSILRDLALQVVMDSLSFKEVAERYIDTLSHNELICLVKQAMSD